MDKQTRLSLIICTKDRAACLQRCLEALDTREMAEVAGEVILVDNGSTDHTPEVACTFRQQAQCPVTLVREETPGLGRARNAGLARAAGEVLAFTDDDCYLASGYLSNASVAFKSAAFDYCGGRILLHDPSDAAYGVNERETLYTIPPYSFIRPGSIQGANMVIHRKVFEKIGGFDPHLGAGTPFRFEDLDLIARASMAGFVGAHVPELTVYHHHGRKPGADIRRLKQKNDYARGAYYAKLAILRNFKFFKSWLSNAAHPGFMRRSLRRVPRTARELRGAFSYLRTRVRRRPPDSVKPYPADPALLGK